MTRLPPHSPEKELWQAVLHKAFVDATATDRSSDIDHRAKHDAHLWITNCGKDFRLVCHLAGMDAEFLSGAYKSGRVNADLLRSGDRKKGSA